MEELELMEWAHLTQRDYQMDQEEWEVVADQELDNLPITNETQTNSTINFEMCESNYRSMNIRRELIFQELLVTH